MVPRYPEVKRAACNLVHTARFLFIFYFLGCRSNDPFLLSIPSNLNLFVDKK